MKFSLLIPSYNRPELIRETVNSVLAIADREVEILVSDDASPKKDRISEALADLVSGGRIRLIHQPRNLGWSENRNALVREARGEWIILLGDDDRVKANFLTRLRWWLQKSPGADLYGFGYDVIDEEGQRVFTYGCPRLMTYGVHLASPWPELFYFDAVPMWSHHPFTLAIHRRVFATLQYNSAAGIGDDVLLLWQALAHGFVFTVIPEKLFEWRNTFRGQAYANLSSDTARLKDSRGAVITELLRDPALATKVRNLIFSRKFLRRFLQATPSGVERVRQVLLRDDRVIARQIVSEMSFQYQEGRWDKVGRHLRAARAMGPRHFWQLRGYFRDRKRLAKFQK